MAESNAKTINLLLYDGNLDGVMSIEDSGWNSGELYYAPRKSISELLETDACRNDGVYFLISESMVYVGKSYDFSKSIAQHTVEKDWWESVVILTTKDDSFNHTDIDYIESFFIDKAFETNHLECEKQYNGNNPKVSKFRKVWLDQYLEEAFFLMKLIGIKVFSDERSVNLNNAIGVNTRLAYGKRGKKDAIAFLEEKGITVGKKTTYAIKQQEKNEFWANPKINLLYEEWWLILNNNEDMELIVLKVPENSLRLIEEDKNGLLTRSDNRTLMDLNINANTFLDRKSGVDFSPFIVKKIKY